MINSWILYFYNRLNVSVFLPVAVGCSVSSSLIGNRGIALSSIFVCFVLFSVLFSYLRLKNDLDDLNKDRIAHPSRPFPLGMLSMDSGKRGLKFFQFLLFFIGILLLLFSNNSTRLMVVVNAVYLFAMNRDFFQKESKKRHPFILQLGRQFFWFFVLGLMLSIGNPVSLESKAGWAYMLLMFASFFTYDIGRKLDPYSHPISLTYIHYFGFKITFCLLVALQILSGFGAFLLDAHRVLWPCEMGVVISLLVLFRHPKKFHFAEIATIFSLVAHSFAGSAMW